MPTMFPSGWNAGALAAPNRAYELALASDSNSLLRKCFRAEGEGFCSRSRS